MNINYKIVCALAVLLISVSSVAALVEEKDQKNLEKESKNIIIGKVINQKSYLEEGKIFTDVTISIEKQIKGKIENQTIKIKVPGGAIGDRIASVSDVPLFEDNEEALLYLRDEYFRVVGWHQGKKTIKDKKIQETGEPVEEYISKIISASNESGIEPKNKEHTISSITPNSGPAKAAQLGSSTAAADSTRVTITGSGFGSTQGTVKFWRVGTTWYNAAIESWSDTQIIARVPGRVSSYYRPGTLSNVEVIRSDTVSGGTTNFHVTYSYGGGKWPGNSMTYRVNPNTADTTDELAAVQAAAATWNGAGANFNYIYGGASTKTSVAYDGENTILWNPANIGAIAIAWTWWYTSDPKTIVETDIEFNDASYVWGTDSSPTKMDVETIALHELGHWLQLLDLYGSTDSGKIMYGYGSVGGIKRDLSTEDIDGIKAIYGTIVISPKLHVFVRGTDNALWYRSLDTTWSSWKSLGGVLTSDPDATYLDGKLYVFVRGSDNKLWYRKFDGTSWSSWANLGGVLTSAPGVSSSWSGQIYVFVRGSDNKLWYRKFDGISWSSWANLGGELTSGPGAS